MKEFHINQLDCIDFWPQFDNWAAEMAKSDACIIFNVQWWIQREFRGFAWTPLHVFKYPKKIK